MFNQHAKWLKVTRDIRWRRPIASLNYLLEPRLAPGPQRLLPPGSGLHRSRRQQEGRRHPRLPAAGRELPARGDGPLPALARLRERRSSPASSRALQWLSMDEAILHCSRGIGIWEWAGTCGEIEPDVVMACCGDVPTLETLAAVDILRRALPDLRIRVVNVVDLMRLQDETRASARPVGRGVRRAVHDVAAGDLRLSRLPVADPPPDVSPHEPRRTSTCAATRKRAPRRRRSTWSCSTTSTGSTS